MEDDLSRRISGGLASLVNQRRTPTPGMFERVTAGVNRRKRRRMAATSAGMAVAVLAIAPTVAIAVSGQHHSEMASSASPSRTPVCPPSYHLPRPSNDARSTQPSSDATAPLLGSDPGSAAFCVYAGSNQPQLFGSLAESATVGATEARALADQLNSAARAGSSAQMCTSVSGSAALLEFKYASGATTGIAFEFSDCNVLTPSDVWEPFTVSSTTIDSLANILGSSWPTAPASPTR